MSELHELVAPYAMDALDSSEREVFEEHLEDCLLCQEELAQLQEATLQLAEQVPRVPPVDLKDKVMSRVTGQRADVSRLEPSHRRPWSWAFAAAAALAVVFAGLWVAVDSQLDHTESVAEVLAAEDAVAIELASDVGDAEFVYSEALGRGVFLDRGLERPAEDLVYELWLVDESGPQPAGIFRPGQTDTTPVLIEGVFPGLVLAMTQEPAGGSQQPTGEILLSAEL